MELNFKYVVIAVVLILSACSDELANEKNREERGAPSQKTLDVKTIEPRERISPLNLSENLKVDIQSADPEKYVVQFSWPYLAEDKILRIRLGGVLAEVLPDQTFFTHTLSHDQSATFSFDILDKKRKLERTFTKTVQIPTDFVVRSTNSIIKKKSKIEVNRFYLGEEIPLRIEDKTVEIITSEFHSSNGVIETFPEKTKQLNEVTGLIEESPSVAPPETPGRNGGVLSISAKKLFGRVQIFMRGEKGGRGAKGASLAQKAGLGTPAGEGRLQCSVPKNDCIRKPFLCSPSHNSESLFENYAASGTCYCKSFGDRGGPGVQGDEGNSGNQGKPGGSSGSVRVSIHEYVPLEGFDSSISMTGGEIVKVHQIPGEGGDGGPGGDGQRGSPGGVGRDSNERDDCRGEPGDEGPIGKPGALGKPGEKGSKGLLCVYVGSENINYCEGR